MKNKSISDETMQKYAEMGYKSLRSIESYGKEICIMCDCLILTEYEKDKIPDCIYVIETPKENRENAHYKNRFKSVLIHKKCWELHINLPLFEPTPFATCLKCFMCENSLNNDKGDKGSFTFSKHQSFRGRACCVGVSSICKNCIPAASGKQFIDKFQNFPYCFN